MTATTMSEVPLTALVDRLTRADCQRLEERLAGLRGTDRLMREAGGLAGPHEPPPLHRLGVTGLAVTSADSQSGLSASSRAVPGIGPRGGEWLPAAVTRPAGRTGKPLLHLPPQTADGSLGVPEVLDHPRFNRHVAEEAETERRAVDGHVSRHDDGDEPLLRGLLRAHVTTIAVTPEPGTLAAPRLDQGDGATERTTAT